MATSLQAPHCTDDQSDQGLQNKRVSVFLFFFLPITKQTYFKTF